MPSFLLQTSPDKNDRHSRRASWIPPSADVLYLRAIQTKLPLSKAQIQTAKETIARLSLEELLAAGLSPPPIPVLDKEVDRLEGSQRLERIQDYISSFQYNFDTGYHFNVQKRRPFKDIMDTASAITHAGLPIKCIEAVFLGLYVTAKHNEWSRYPIGFKSVVPSPRTAFRHIVLAIFDKKLSMWGCLGISRKANLMYKPLTYKSLSELMADFKESFAVWGHNVIKIRVGAPALRNIFSPNLLIWRSHNFKVTDEQWKCVCEKLDAVGSTPPESVLQCCKQQQCLAQCHKGEQTSHPIDVTPAAEHSILCSDSEEDVARKKSRSRSLSKKRR